jgi:hypothetical protein
LALARIQVAAWANIFDQIMLNGRATWSWIFTPETTFPSLLPAFHILC